MAQFKFIKNKKFGKKFWVFLSIFMGVGIYILSLSLASPYKPYNPPFETGQATYYNNNSVGGSGYCAAIHYSRGKKLKVTNLKAGDPLHNTSITCTVSDAGPFGDGRVIDLNTVDFRTLAGSNSVGVLKVQLELVLEPEIPPEPAVSYDINCVLNEPQNNLTPATLNSCELNQATPPIESPTEQTAEIPPQNDFEKIFIFTKEVLDSILNIF